MLKLLIAVDGSDPALRATDAAARLGAHTTGLSAVMLNVRRQAPYLGERPPFDAESVERRLDAEQAELLDLAASRARRAGLDALRVCGAVGDAADEIVRVACEEQVDMVVMGTRGRSRLAGLLIGSVAQRVVHLAPCPVLLCK